MINTVNTNTNSNVVVVTAPGPSGPIGPQGPTGSAGTIQTNSGTIVSPFLIVNGQAIITGSLTVSGSNTFRNIGPALFTGSVDVLGNLTVNGTSSATVFSGSGAQLFNIPASGITGLNLSRIATGGVSASVSTGGTAFILNSGATNLFTISSAGVGTLSGGLTVTGSTLLNGTTVLNGTATLNGSAILTTATVSTSRISDSNISASVSSTGKAFNVSNGATSLMSVDQNGAISGSGLYVSGSAIYIDGPAIRLYGNATLNNAAITTTATTTTDRIQSGTITASVATLGNALTLQNSGNTVASISTSGQVSASGFIGDGSGLTGVGIIYNSGSNPLINSIQVADFDNNVVVTFVDGNLKFVFGTPVIPEAPSISLSGFATDRFNKQSDTYDVISTWDVGGYSLVSAKLLNNVTGQLLSSTTSGASLSAAQTTTGSGQTYKIEVTASSPLDGTISRQESFTTGNISKSNPGPPTISITSNTVGLGISGGIEEGDLGDINFTTTAGSANNWEFVSLVTIPGSSPQSISSPTSAVTIFASASYQSPVGTNDPQRFISTTATTTYNRIRSLRFGASAASSFTLAELQDLTLWDTTLGGTIGTIRKGTISPSGQTVSITWSGDKYHYIIYNSSQPDLTVISSGGVNTIALWTLSTVESPSNVRYKVYRTTDLQTGGTSKTATYVLT
jgi:hypothetical protein